MYMIQKLKSVTLVLYTEHNRNKSDAVRIYSIETRLICTIKYQLTLSTGAKENKYAKNTSVTSILRKSVTLRPLLSKLESLLVFC